MRTPGGIIVPDRLEPPRIHLVLTGRDLLDADDGYHGAIEIRKGAARVRLRVTDKQHAALTEMGIEEQT